MRQEMKTTFDPKIHSKSKYGNGYGLKKGKKIKKINPTPDGLELAKIFGWKTEKRNNNEN